MEQRSEDALTGYQEEQHLLFSRQKSIIFILLFFGHMALIIIFPQYALLIAGSILCLIIYGIYGQIKKKCIFCKAKCESFLIEKTLKDPKYLFDAKLRTYEIIACSTCKKYLKRDIES